ncbi:MAG: hypothetical protein KAH04_07735, partial [Psychrilyobacter sp.]|nr:hypothetical protein [Psychrilyobacter sp.]
MKLRKTTEDKINKINKLLEAGEEKEVIKTLFGRNKIKYEEYIKKYSDHIIMAPTEAPEIESNNLVVSDKNELQILDNE